MNKVTIKNFTWNRSKERFQATVPVDIRLTGNGVVFVNASGAVTIALEHSAAQGGRFYLLASEELADEFLELVEKAPEPTMTPAVSPILAKANPKAASKAAEGNSEKVERLEKLIQALERLEG